MNSNYLDTHKETAIEMPVAQRRFYPASLSILAALAALVFAALSPVARAQLDGPSLSSFTEPDRNRFKPLSLEQAFPYYLSAINLDKYRLTWDTAPEHYLYQNQFNFSFQKNAEASPKPLTVQLPDGIKKTDEFFGDVEVYFSQLSVDLNLPDEPEHGSQLIIEFQGCAEWGFCYPPQKIFLPLD